MSTKMRRYAQKKLAEWAVPFGFGHYTILVTLDPAESGTDKPVWATIHSNVEEEWLQVYLDEGLEQLNEAQVEHVVVHELAHTLFDFAKASKSTLEMYCNRIASMLVGAEFGLREFFQGHTDAARRFFSTEEREALENVLPHMVLRLPPEDRDIILALDYDACERCKGTGSIDDAACIYCEGSGYQSLRALAEKLGVEPSTVLRRRRRIINDLRKQFLGGDDA